MTMLRQKLMARSRREAVIEAKKHTPDHYALRVKLFAYSSIYDQSIDPSTAPE